MLYMIKHVQNSDHIARQKEKVCKIWSDFFKKERKKILKLFELLNKVTHLWSYAIRCLSFWKQSRFLEEQWVGKL